VSNLPVCDFMHESEVDTGWEIVDVHWNETVTVKHLVPCGDLRQHQLDPSCWCKPVEDAETADFWIHNSADRRELFETGAARPS
jgi:dihydroorotase